MLLSRRILAASGWIGFVLIAALWLVTNQKESSSDIREHEDADALTIAQLQKELQRLKAERDGTNKGEGDTDQARLGELSAEIEALRERNAELQTSLEAKSEEKVDVPSGLDWRGYSSLVAKNLDILNVEFNKLTPEQQADLKTMYAELSKLGAQARISSEFPLLDPTVFGDVMQAIFGESLDLTEEQLATMSDAIDTAFADIPENLEDLRALERHRTKNELLSSLWNELEDIVDREQGQQLAALQKYTESFLREGNVVEYGLELKATGSLEDMMGRQIETAYGLRENQKAMAEEWLSGWISEGEAIVKRYGHDKAAIKSLTPIQRAAMEREFLEAQTRFEENLVPILDDEQRNRLYESSPTFFRFSLGGGSMSIGYGLAF